jgi:ribosomal-protein-serine acetyltransferase
MITIPARAQLRGSPLLTVRTYLTPIDVADTPDLFDAIEESRAYLFPWLPWVPFNADLPSSERFIEACADDWDMGRAMRFVIRERGTKRFLGIAGLERCSHLNRSCELGYWLRQSVQGKGLMTEACALILKIAFEHLNVHRLRVAAATNNHKSLSVIGRLGFRFEGIEREAEFCAGRWLDHASFGMLATDLRK